MKRMLRFIIILLPIIGLIACGEEEKTPQEPEIITEQITIDSLAMALREVDSIFNSGQLVHLDVYDIGMIKDVYVSVQKLVAGDLSAAWINLRKDCGGERYYSWEDARLLDGECHYFINAINTINSNRERMVDHEEKYAYVTKDNIRVFAYAKKAKTWTVELSVDYHKQNSTIVLNSKDIADFISLIQKAQLKITEIN